MTNVVSPEILKDIMHYNHLKTEHDLWTSHWNEITKNIIPRKDNFNEGFRTKGEKKGRLIFDSTAPTMNKRLASALQSGLSNPTVQFFELTTGIDNLDKQDGIRQFLQISTRRMHQILANSNFQPHIHEIYLDLGSFGTSFLGMEEDPDDIIRFISRPIQEVVVDESAKGQIDLFFRRFRFTVRQIAQEFGEDVLDDSFKRMLKEHKQTQHEILHKVGPWPKDKPNPQGFSFESKFILLKTKQLLNKETDGFREFPAAITRWSKISGEMYGRSPGMDALPSIKMLNSMMEVTIRAAQKVVDPPMLSPDDGITLPLKTFPNGITYFRPGSEKPEPLATGARVDFGIEMIEFVRQEVREAYFIDQLQLPVDGPQMTATESSLRKEDNTRILAPVLARFEFELLRPIVDRLFGIMGRKNLLPEVPPELEGQDLQVKYSSVFAKAQKSGEAGNLLRAISNLGPLIEANPAVLDNIDDDEAFRFNARIFNVPVEIVRNKGEVEAIREQRQELLQRQQELNENQQQAETANKLAPLASA